MKRKTCLMAAVFFLAVLFMFPVSDRNQGNPFTAEAAVSSSTRKKAKAAYKRFLMESDYRRFRFFDVNGDKLKELLVTYDRAPYMVGSIFVYTYRNGRVVWAGQHYSMFGFTYNKKLKRIQGSRGGGGGIENWYYTLNKSGRLKQVYLQAIEKGMKNGKMRYNYYYNGKKISQKSYNSKRKLWAKNTQKFTFYSLNNKNLKAQLKKF